MVEISSIQNGRELLTEIRLVRREMAELGERLDARLRQLELAAARDHGAEASRQHRRTTRAGLVTAGISATVSAAITAIVSWISGHWH